MRWLPAVRTLLSRRRSSAPKSLLEHPPGSPVGPHREWGVVAQLLSTLRTPEAWFESISEEVQLVDGRLFRAVSIKINRERARDLRSAKGELYLVLLKPKKGVQSNITLGSFADDGRARMLEHREHRKVTQYAIMYRFMSVVRILAARGDDLRGHPDVWKTLDSLVRIPVVDAATAKAILAEAFDEKQWLPSLPPGVRRSSDLTLWVGRLYALCLELTEHYYKIVKVNDFANGPRRIEYTHDQPQEGRGKLRRIRAAFNAAPGNLRVHVPLARLTQQYEIHMPAIDGHFVYAQRVVKDAWEGNLWKRQQAKKALKKERRALGKTQTGAHNEIAEIEVARSPGRSLAPRLFISKGTKATRRIYVAATYFESPPGSTGKAFFVHLISFIVALVLVWWSLSHHEGGAPSDVAALVATLVAVGSAATDALVPRVPSLTAPLIPRVFLYSQSIYLIGIALWILVRGSRGTLEPQPGDFAVLSIIDVPLGITLGALVFIQLLILFIQLMRLAWANTKTGTQHLRGLANG